MAGVYHELQRHGDPSKTWRTSPGGICRVQEEHKRLPFATRCCALSQCGLIYTPIGIFLEIFFISKITSKIWTLFLQWFAKIIRRRLRRFTGWKVVQSHKCILSYMYIVTVIRRANLTAPVLHFARISIPANVSLRGGLLVFRA